MQTEAELYKALGLHHGASDADVKIAFKRLALKYHPDRHVGSNAEGRAYATAKFQAAKQAYEILLDGRKRATLAASSNSYRPSAYGSTVNTDWSKSYYQHQKAARYPRSGLWETVGRAARLRLQSSDVALHMGLGVILLGGLFVFDQVSRAVWSFHNEGKQFHDIVNHANSGSSRRRDT